MLQELRRKGVGPHGIANGEGELVLVLGHDGGGAHPLLESRPFGLACLRAAADPWGDHEIHVQQVGLQNGGVAQPTQDQGFWPRDLDLTEFSGSPVSRGLAVVLEAAA